MNDSFHKCIDELGRKVKEDGKQLFFIFLITEG